MTWMQLRSILELGFLYGIMTIGVYMSYRILKVPDLTVDGSFTLGAAVSVVLSVLGYPMLGIILGASAGLLAGLVTAILQTKLKIQPILAGILVMTGLYTINIWAMGNRPNVALGMSPSVFSKIRGITEHKWLVLMMIFIVVAVLIGVLTVFLHTSLGLSIRATGDNEDMVRSTSINVERMKTIGLCLANMLVALSGALIGQYQGFSDISMGVGIVIMGLASLIIGEVIVLNLYEAVFKKQSILVHLIAVALGAVAYRTIIWGALEIKLSPASMKLVSAIIITIAISYPTMKEYMKLNAQKRLHRLLLKKAAKQNDKKRRSRGVTY